MINTEIKIKKILQFYASYIVGYNVCNEKDEPIIYDQEKAYQEIMKIIGDKDGK